MLRRDITYQDLEGNPITETHYFHLSKADLIEMQLSKKGGFEEWLKKVIEAEDGKTLVHELKEIILMSYGKKSEDGKRFIKSDELRAEFANSEAFSELFSEIALDADKAQAFVNGVIPRELTTNVAPGQTSVFDKDEPQPEGTIVESPPKAPMRPIPQAQPVESD